MFRGKRIDNGEWVDGCYMTDEQDLSKAYIGHIFGTDGDGMFIHDMDVVRVVPETVCQYTGLKDEYGNKIWENDILSFPAYGEKYKGYVKFVDGNFVIWCGKCAPFLDDALEKYSATVIGNIFDNPELVESNA